MDFFKALGYTNVGGKIEEQPTCPFCGDPLEVIEVQKIHIMWKWDKEKKEYIKTITSSDSFQPECSTCGVKSWEFTNNKMVKY